MCQSYDRLGFPRRKTGLTFMKFNCVRLIFEGTPNARTAFLAPPTNRPESLSALQTNRASSQLLIVVKTNQVEHQTLIHRNHPMGDVLKTSLSVCDLSGTSGVLVDRGTREYRALNVALLQLPFLDAALPKWLFGSWC